MSRYGVEAARFRGRRRRYRAEHAAKLRAQPGEQNVRQLVYAVALGDLHRTICCGPT